MNYVLIVKICTKVTHETLSRRKKRFPQVSVMWEGCGDRPQVQTQVKEEPRIEEESVRELLSKLSPSFLFSS